MIVGHMREKVRLPARPTSRCESQEARHPRTHIAIRGDGRLVPPLADFGSGYHHATGLTHDQWGFRPRGWTDEIAAHKTQG
jgi:hypothetical protein